MNARINELLKQSRTEYWTQYTPSYDYEKFAELIIKEYETFLPEICPWADSDKEGPMKGWHVQYVVRKHFGIEE